MTYEEAKKIIPTGVYKNNKRQTLYEVLYIAKHSENLSPMVIYQALYGDREIWCRPADMWLERFTFIKEAANVRKNDKRNTL